MQEPNILRKLRSYYNHKQESLAQQLGLISQSSYSKMENRKIENLSPKHLKKLAEVYNTTEEELLNGNFKGIIIGDIHNNVNGVVIHQGEVTYQQNPQASTVDERIVALEAKIEQLLQKIS